MPPVPRPGGCRPLRVLEPRGPVALPVNFRMFGDDVVFRTAALSSVRSATHGGRVGFEVDHIDDAMREGWSVLVTGYALELRDVEQRQRWNNWVSSRGPETSVPSTCASSPSRYRVDVSAPVNEEHPVDDR